MEKTENKYQRGKIYKIISNQTNDVYYGSTIEPYLTNRLSAHRQKYQQWLNGKYHYVSSFEIIKFEDAKIILIQNFPCKTKDDLCAREQYHIDNNNCVNKFKAFTGLSSFDYMKQYRKDNIDTISESKKQYYEKNKLKINERHQQYYEKNKSKLNQHIDCICGGKYTHQHKLEHEKTKKHQQFISNLIVEK